MITDQIGGERWFKQRRIVYGRRNVLISLGEIIKSQPRKERELNQENEKQFIWFGFRANEITGLVMPFK